MWRWKAGTGINTYKLVYINPRATHYNGGAAGGGYKGDVVRRGTRNRHSGPTNYIQKVTDGALERCDY